VVVADPLAVVPLAAAGPAATGNFRRCITPKKADSMLLSAFFSGNIEFKTKGFIFAAN
jgi:hypothetical protein